ncbi:CapA family protein [Desulfosporosinus sp. BICA1-9]|uniref:CapA family protein n=1 Tax=Desulfosporosinus sp. BICA1-9 TaxID=1531958 RepID=UPI00054B8F24|nr:CapA family protein [Desulfosporosinus sp. BICA1-9]KJS46320.1 MAG: capsular biosynthesis protein [Peptococcaceae bacterium BRH_c23]KJS90261.1 MAG: capsular biosynthesis protein [Desulfosporosinus sp. BICA1-9]HBW34305.1 CapA family protein [Desulfosporosinus sp.]
MMLNVKSFLMLVLCLILTGCSTIPTLSSSLTPSEVSGVVQQPSTNPEPKAPKTEAITLVATGDILMHNTQIWGGQQLEGSYNFDSFFSPVEHLIKVGDYASTNFEAPMAGPDSGYTGYPLFNSPDAIADTFKKSGFDLIVTANNHILDRGYKGALRTLEVLRNASLDTTGCFSNLEAHNSPLIKSVRGIKIGYIAYTYGVNGIPLPQHAPYLVNIMDPDKIMADISTLRPKVDVLVLVLHWGEEYRQQPTEQQKELAQKFLEADVDVILGSHPHVIEPMEIKKINGKNKFVIYSLGNFISAQNGLERNSGLVLNLQFVKDFDTNTTSLKKISYDATYSHAYRSNGKLQYRVVPILETIQKIKDGTEQILTPQDLPILEKALEQTRKQLGDPMHEL